MTPQRRSNVRARLVSPRRPSLALVCAQLLVAPLDRDEELDDGLADILLEAAVAAPVVAGLELGDRVAGRDGHDLEQVRDAGLLLSVVPDLGARVRDRE